MKEKTGTQFFSSLLTVLGVRHTQEYSDRRFCEMPFKTMFGLSKLAEEYGIGTLGVRLDDKGEAWRLPMPFVAPVHCGAWVTVTKVDHDADTVTYVSHGLPETTSTGQFNASWNGTALLVKADSRSVEPGYVGHRFVELMTSVRDYGVILLATALAVYAFIVNWLYSSYATIFLVLFNLVGAAASVMLSQKSIGIETKTSARICSAIQTEGCDHVVNKGGTFLGILHWSDVGMGYFGVSLIALLCFPEKMLGWLTLFNVCCLPYSFWSVGYQKFVAKSWCTLCLIVQVCLWVLAAFYLTAGGWHCINWHDYMDGIILLAFYVLSVLGLNLVLSWIKERIKPDDQNS